MLEMIDSQSYELSKSYLSNEQAIPRLSPSDFYIIMEIHSDISQSEADNSLRNFLITIDKHIEGVVIAKDEMQRKGISDIGSKVTNAFINKGIVYLSNALDIHI